jgi:hypothetical protein
MASLNLLRNLRDRIGTAATWLGDRFKSVSGKLLGRKETASLVGRTVDMATAAHLAPLAERVASGSITVDVWLTAMRTEVKNLYLTQYIVARGGLGQMTFADWGRLGAMLKDQYGYLDGFAEYIKANNPSAAYIAMRARLYADASHEAFERARTLIALEKGADEISWHIDPAAENCSDCVDWEAMGWQSIGPRGGFPSPKGEAWPGSGLSKCLVRCRCSTTYRNSKTGEEWSEGGYAPLHPPVFEEGGPGSGWFAPPKGTHGAGNQGGSLSQGIGDRGGGAGSAPEGDYDPFDAKMLDEFIGKGSEVETRVAAVNGIQKEGGPENYVSDDIISQWNSASSYAPDSLALQQDAADAFGVKLPEYVKYRLNDAGGPATSAEQRMSFLNGTYLYTQGLFKEHGFNSSDTIRLQRGVHISEQDLGDIGRGGTIKLMTNPLSSWTADLSGRTSAIFARSPGAGFRGVIVEMAIPVSSIISTCRTGLGSLSAKEFVVLGGENIDHVARIVEVY